MSFSAAVLEHTLNPRNVGPLDGANRYGQSGEPGDGPYVQLWLLVEGGKIERAAYGTYGCPAAVACASLACELLTGRTAEWARKLEASDLALMLGGLPEGKEYCPQLVVTALSRALVGEAA